jgi:S-adenosylmethionine:tRNA ribosyltransferase-isomerase
MQFDLLKTDGAARRGRLAFPRGTVETPAFMPVGTYGSVKGMLPGQLRGLGAELVQQVRRARAAGGRVVAVGTTVVRALESAMQGEELRPFAGDTSIFLFPGVRIRSVDALLTNFHLPESTLLMLVSAFAGKERIFAAYEHAVRERYRFFSYGDAMLLWPGSGVARIDDRG